MNIYRSSTTACDGSIRDSTREAHSDASYQDAAGDRDEFALRSGDGGLHEGWSILGHLQTITSEKE